MVELKQNLKPTHPFPVKETLEDLPKFECFKWVLVLGFKVLCMHMLVHIQYYRVSMLFSTKVQDLLPFVSSPILWGTLLLVALMTYKLGLNVLNIDRKKRFFKISVDEVIHSLFYSKKNDFFIIVLLYVFNNFKSLNASTRTTPSEYVTTLNLD